MDVAGWLRGLGLGQYEANFRDNKIDADMLPRLAGDDLKDIGVSAFGDRLRLLDAIAALVVAKPSTDVAASSSRSATPKVSQVSAERRPITVMFCDLVGSTTLAAKLDAEDWRNLVSAYLDEASAAVTGLGGHVLKKLGDGLMALFGYPHAQENDAERALRAALAIQRALAELNARNARSGAPQLSARIGIDCGSVVVDATGEVFGDAPNIAARVQSAAEPGTILITATVQRQTAGLFVAEDRGQLALKGVSTPLTLYRIIRGSGAGRRGGARALTLLVGREEELDLLTRRWERARKGEGQLALVVGEPGLGKSRLIGEFRVRLGEAPHTWVEWSSSQLLQNTPLHPIAEWGRLRFGADLPAEQRLADLENTLALVGLDPAEYAPLVAPLVAVALPDDRHAKLAPEELRRRQLAAMTAFVLAGARSQPAVVAFEDLHWADPSSLDLLRALAERGAQAPLLLIATTRPEFRPPWSVRSHHSVISLSPLDRAQVARMVGELASRHALSREVVERVSERTGGVPLFVEEVTRLLLERGVEGGAQTIPPTLQQSLAARLDRLGPAREIAQIGAVLGRDFPHALLQAVAGLDEAGLHSSLERLAEADILFVEGAAPQASYRFKHALIQDAAYESLLKSRRQPLHRRAAEVLRESGAEPETIAHHFTEAGLDDLAIEWWGKAGDQALRRSAFQEAIAHLGKAIAMADKAASAKMVGGSGHSLQLQVSYGNALIAARGYGAAETTKAFARARESVAGDENAPERLAADYGLWVGSLLRGELSAMREHSTAFVSDVRANPDSPEAGVAHRTAGITHWFAGEYVRAHDHLERALALFQPGRDDDLAFRFGQDAGVAAMLFLAFTLWPLGGIERAISLVDDAEARIAGLAHIGTRAYGRMHAALFALMRGDLSRAMSNAAELARLTREHDLLLWQAFGVFLEGLASAHQSIPAGGALEDMRRGVEGLREQNALIFDGLIRIALAKAEARAGDIDCALGTLDDALSTSERTGHRAFEAELHRARGELLLGRHPANPKLAEEAFQTAMAVAKQQAGRSFELRAALSLAKLYQSTGRPAEAHAVLAPALEGFSPTPGMPEIAEAEALLAALAETEEVKADGTQRQRRGRLQVAYGNALIAARGFGAPETTEAFAKARASSSDERDSPERLAADFGLWAGSYTRGELAPMRAHAAAFLADIEGRPDSPEAGIAHRAQGITHWFAGEFRPARDHLGRALALFQSGRDDDLTYRFGMDPGVPLMAYLGFTLWVLGEADRAVSFIESARERVASLTHAHTLALGTMHAAFFELMRGDRLRARTDASELARILREHDLRLFRAFGEFLDGWLAADGGAFADGLEGMRRGAESLREQNATVLDGLIKMLLSQAEARAGDPERALADLDEALATVERLGFRAFESELHRARGELLLGRDADNLKLAEEAFLTAIAVARQQGTRSFELRAALALAKLYQSNGRPAEAHAVLAPALEGFLPTLEMPEIAEAQALLAALAADETVNAASASRKQRVDLHVAYGSALLKGRGMGAPETRAAFERARELAAVGVTAPRPEITFGLWSAAEGRGELGAMREFADAFQREVKDSGQSLLAGIAHRVQGVTKYLAGEFLEARAQLEQAVAMSNPARDAELAHGFAADPGILATAYLAHVLWPLGQVDEARRIAEDLTGRVARATDLGSIAYGRINGAQFEMMRGDFERAAPQGKAFANAVRENNSPQWEAFVLSLDGWSRWHEGDRDAGRARMREGVAKLDQLHFVPFDGLFKGTLATLEAEGGDFGAALSLIDSAIAVSDRTGFCNFDAEVHRIRGEILLKHNPVDPAPAEAAFLTAIAVAQRQGARSYELLASLSLAKLYQSTGRPNDAHAVLAPALEGFSPTPEMPEIAEAQALIERSA